MSESLKGALPLKAKDYIVALKLKSGAQRDYKVAQKSRSDA